MRAQPTQHGPVHPRRGRGGAAGGRPHLENLKAGLVDGADDCTPRAHDVAQSTHHDRRSARVQPRGGLVLQAAVTQRSDLLPLPPSAAWCAGRPTKPGKQQQPCPRPAQILTMKTIEGLATNSTPMVSLCRHTPDRWQRAHTARREPAWRAST